MQEALWKERFGSKIVFYDEAIFDGSAVTEAVLETRPDIVIWLAPLLRTPAIFSKLKDRGIKSFVIADEMAANGDACYYLSWRHALMWGMADWKRSETRTVVIIKGAPSDSARTLRLLYSALTKAGLDFRLHEASELRTGKDFSGPTRLGIIFISAQSLIQFAQGGVQMVERLLRYSRVLFIHGHVDLPYQPKLSCCFDTIKFEWPTISSRIVRDLIASRCNGHIEKQTIFKGKWYNGISFPSNPDRPAFAIRTAAQ
jgi:hypothetical protein